MSEPRPFRIAVPDATLADLRERLTRTRWPDHIAAYGWAQGTEPGTLRELLEAWRSAYDWRVHEARLNTFAQYTAEVQGQGLHFLHVRSSQLGARPLLLVHGWPGSIVEFARLIPLLSEPQAHGAAAADAFHVVAPSLPGYAFSPAPREPGAGPRRMAGWLHALMRDVLGYRRYFAQGGDWGSTIASWAAFDQPAAVAGLHLNMAGLRPPLGPQAPPLSEEERAFLAAAAAKRSDEFGYQAIQGTRPQTLGYALNDSPAGLAAWIVEKFRAWSDCDGELERAIPREDLLTNLTLYWATGCITSSMRLYYEFRRGEAGPPPGRRVEVPTAFAAFPREILSPPRSFVERAYRIVRWTPMPRGGHFAALEAPELLAADIRAAFAGQTL
jgi:pimeloyl-ACP methyl ester carboxylesterase